MSSLPVMLKLSGRRCLVVGCGSVAMRRARSLADCGAAVTLVAPKVDDAAKSIDAKIERRSYQSGDLRDVFLVVIATDDEAVNRQIADDAASAGVLINRADDPEGSDVQIPAVGRDGDVTVAVHTGNVSARAAAAIRDELMQSLDRNWVTLLAVAAPVRKEIQQSVSNVSQRQELLRRLADEHALASLKQGGVDALKEHYRKILQSAAI